MKILLDLYKEPNCIGRVTEVESVLTYNVGDQLVCELLINISSSSIEISNFLEIDGIILYFIDENDDINKRVENYTVDQVKIHRQFDTNNEKHILNLKLNVRT